MNSFFQTNKFSEFSLLKQNGMKQIITTLILLLVILGGCQKDISQFTEIPGKNYKSNILGMVLDEEDQPVVEAIVNFGGKTVTTDVNGIYQFKNVDISSQHSFLSIQKDGYFTGSRAFNTFEPGKTLNLRNVLLKKNFDQTFDSSSGGEIRDSGLTIKFSPNSIMYDNSNTEYSGTIHAAIKYLDPLSDEIYTQMPGNLSAIDENDNVTTLITYGMVAVELHADDGQKLNLKNGSKAEMSIELPSSKVSSAPQNIPLWYFDDQLGYWIEEGFATLNGDTYTGEVSHFSWWNYDVPYPPINLSGRVVDMVGNPLANVTLSFFIQGSSNWVSSGRTNSDGTFSGPVPKDMDLIVQVELGGCNYVIQNSQIGPFSQDATIPDIVVDNAHSSSYLITGNVIDCNQNLVENGYIKLVGQFINETYPIVNGEVSIQFFHCSNLNFDVIAVDVNTLKESFPLKIIGEGEYHFDSIEACELTTEYIILRCDSEPFLSEVMTKNLLLSGHRVTSENKDHKGLRYWINENEATIFSYADFDFIDYSPGVFNTGTYPFHGTIKIANSLETGVPTGTYTIFLDYYDDDRPDGDVTILNKGFHGDMVKGTFRFRAVLHGSPYTSLEFSGSFFVKAFMYN